MDQPQRSRGLILALIATMIAVVAAGWGAGRLLLGAPSEDLRPILTAVGLAFLILAGLAGWLVWRFASNRVDWRRIEVEQRLWESGPLGRTWLRIRQRIAGRWFDR